MEYIKGRIVFKAEDFLIFETLYGEGLKIWILKKETHPVNDEIKLFIHKDRKIDGNTLNVNLFGFANLEHLQLFRLFIEVKGIGAKKALSILENPLFELLDAIYSEDLLKLSAFVGLCKFGPAIVKEANKADNKLMIESILKTSPIFKQSKRSEALQILKSLNFDIEKVNKALDLVENIEKQRPEETVKQAIALIVNNYER